MTALTIVSSSDFWGDPPSPLVRRAYKPIQRGQMKRRRPRLLWPTFDRKVSPEGWLQESLDRWVPQRVPNSFGLPAGKSCPGKTSFCDGCYAAGSEQSAGVLEAMFHNLKLLQAAGTTDAMAELLSEMVGSYVFNAVREQLSPLDRIFRIHWDGDFFSWDYAKAWAMVIRAYPGIRFWAYTRSFVEPVNVVAALVGMSNLALYLSVDDDNVEAARVLLPQFADQGLKVAACAVDYRAARIIEQRATELCTKRFKLPCPENSKANPMGLMEDGRGACIQCQFCPDAKGDVLFASSGLEDEGAKHGQQVLGEVRLATPRVRRPKPTTPEPNRTIAETTSFSSIEDLELFEAGPDAG